MPTYDERSTHNSCRLQILLKDLNSIPFGFAHKSVWMDHVELKPDKIILVYSQSCDFPQKLIECCLVGSKISKFLLFNDASSSCCGRNEK